MNPKKFINSCITYLQKNWLSLLISLIAIIFLVPIFLHRLGYSSLLSYDEAWYGEIARNIVLSKNPLRLTFNQTVFTDHPPAGLILMAVSTFALGSNEFSVRLISAFLGIGTVITVFLIGKKIKNNKAGIIASAVLLSSMWFMLRARSGNLDVPFLFFETMTVLALLYHSKKSLYLAAVSFALLFLTKTLVGMGLLPLIIFILFWRAHQNSLNKKVLIKSIMIWFILVLPWYIYNYSLDRTFLNSHFFGIGMRGEENQYTFHALSQNLHYLAIGIGRWYKVFLISILILLGSFIIQAKVRLRIAVLLLWLAGFSLFLFSSKTEVWHLLPLYPIVAVIIGVGLTTFPELFVKNKQKLLSSAGFGLVGLCVLLAIFQFYQFSNLIYPGMPTVSAEKDIALQASQFHNLYLMETFYPVAVYYSGQKIRPLYWHEQAYQKMSEMLETQQEAYFITNLDFVDRLIQDGVEFEVVARNEQYVVVSAF